MDEQGLCSEPASVSTHFPRVTIPWPCLGRGILQLHEDAVPIRPGAQTLSHLIERSVGETPFAVTARALSATPSIRVDGRRSPA